MELTAKAEWQQSRNGEYLRLAEVSGLRCAVSELHLAYCVPVEDGQFAWGVNRCEKFGIAPTLADAKSAVERVLTAPQEPS